MKVYNHLEIIANKFLRSGALSVKCSPMFLAGKQYFFLEIRYPEGRKETLFMRGE